MVCPAIHRLVEHRAAAGGEVLAYVDDSRTLTYGDLNMRANAVARALMASGFRRGAVAAVRDAVAAGGKILGSEAAGRHGRVLQMDQFSRFDAR